MFIYQNVCGTRAGPCLLKINTFLIGIAKSNCKTVHFCVKKMFVSKKCWQMNFCSPVHQFILSCSYLEHDLETYQIFLNLSCPKLFLALCTKLVKNIQKCSYRLVPQELASRHVLKFTSTACISFFLLPTQDCLSFSPRHEVNYLTV